MSEPADQGAVTEPTEPTEPSGPAELIASSLAQIADTVRELAVSSERYHARAQQRESVIDHLHAEVDLLRRGERRALLRPLLSEVCRLRDDLLRQADDLPEDFSSERARILLQSYAESAAIALENSGVIPFAPGEDDLFDARTHRRVGVKPTGDPARHGRVADVRRNGYLDIESNSCIAPADVVLFTYSGDHEITDSASVTTEGSIA